MKVRATAGPDFTSLLVSLSRSVRPQLLGINRTAVRNPGACLFGVLHKARRKVEPPKPEA